MFGCRAPSALWMSCRDGRLGGWMSDPGKTRSRFGRVGVGLETEPAHNEHHAPPGEYAWPVGPPFSRVRLQERRHPVERSSPHGDDLPGRRCFATGHPPSGRTTGPEPDTDERVLHRRIPRRRWSDAFVRMAIQDIDEPVGFTGTRNKTVTAKTTSRAASGTGVARPADRRRTNPPSDDGRDHDPARKLGPINQNSLHHGGWSTRATTGPLHRPLRTGSDRRPDRRVDDLGRWFPSDRRSGGPAGPDAARGPPRTWAATRC